eukprot:gene3388-6042_t
MLDLFTIFTQGGLVLWCFQGPQLVGGDPINGFLQEVLIEGRGASEDTYTIQNYAVKYTMDAPTNLIFAGVFNKTIAAETGYIGHLLNVVKKDFTTRFQVELKEGKVTGYEYNNIFLKAYDKARSDFEQELGLDVTWSNANFFLPINKLICSTIDRERHRKEIARQYQTKNANAVLEEDDGHEDTNRTDPDTMNGNDQDLNAEENRRRMLQKLQGRGTRDRGGGRKKKQQPKAPPSSQTPPRSSTSMRVPVAELKRMDYTNPEDKKSANELSNEELHEMRTQGEIMQRGLQDVDFGFEDEDEDDLMGQDNGDNNNGPQSSSSKGSLFSIFQKITGTSELTRDNVEPVLYQMQQHLMAKNVAADVAEKLCASVGEKLIGTSKGTFTTIKSVIRQALEEALTQILSPKRQVDVLRDIREAKAQHRPFSIVFCGVNGVGKSTNLSKIAFLLLNNNFRILIAACDTFRSGAVEQLRTHCRKLRAIIEDRDDKHPRVNVYDRGYGKNDADVAADALRIAKSEKYDVVLIDTAGRMQDNEPLMRSLTQLIRVNNPDLVLFVGEALVGNEAVDQLTKFNKALQDFSEQYQPRVIDGIVLTKFDTVDDKVGSSISMTYITGKPIVFVGTGQHYHNLRSLNVKSVVQALLKPVQ